MTALPTGAAGRVAVWGVLNVTPDSFSDGGRFGADARDSAGAVAAGRALAAAGADVVDVGGESTRPGSEPVGAAEEWARVGEVVAGLAAAGVPVSIDTTRASTAERALDAGATWVNDVSGGLADPDLLPLVAERGAPVVLMHWRGPSADMQSRALYDDVVAEVADALAACRAAALRAGVAAGRVVLDPGLGFGKTAEHNWALLAGLPRLAALGAPLLVGASRKSFLGRLLAAGDGTPRPVEGRETASSAVVALAVAAGAAAVRVHDVAGARDAAAVGTAVRSAARVGKGEPVLAPGAVP